MDRKDFIKNCGFACVSGAAFSAILQGCTSTKIMGGKITGDELIVAISDFETKAGNEKHFKKYVVVQNDLLQYPICVYRLNENEYSALWMQCTHQGAELQVFGDKLQCPAHGSEFSNKGDLQTGPAETKLRTFPVTIEAGLLKISLKAI
ncbi:MAG: Rieske (2Fe-2S) protein [Chitinophagaceae bacterium]|nr:Rieske (2Fe-2S) protein [Chitinophagaceae bacterium]